MPPRKGSIRLFQLFGITVYLDWAWFLLAIWRIQARRDAYGSIVWNILEVLLLFLIVLMHEFGHALACRQVGGKAERIILWPLGGVAYVSPPPRPGAMLWSIAAGPLVNVALFPVLYFLREFAIAADWPHTLPNAFLLVSNLKFMNTVLLVFNMIPIYPLDGGQILQSLLWFVVGRARSLMIASIIGLAGAAAGIALTIAACLVDPVNGIWFGVLTAFVVLQSWSGFQQARFLSRLANAPRREGFACPACKAVPPAGPFWRCGRCGKGFDPFATQGICPSCSAAYGIAACFECGTARPIPDWFSAGIAPSNLPPPVPGPPPFGS